MTDYHQSDHAGDAGSPYHHSVGTDHRDTRRARQAAEALFAPKQRIIEAGLETDAVPAVQTTRKPRILSAVQAPPTRDEPTKTPVVAVPPKPREKIPASHLGRIRTWMKYGMTMAQVANVYGVTVDVIEATLKKV